MKTINLHSSMLIMKLMAAVVAVLTIFSSVPAFSQVTYEAYGNISANRERAALIYRRLTGTKIPIDSAVIIQMEQLLNQNQPIAAAALATDSAAFYNNVLRLFGQKLTTKDDTYKAPLSDMVATIMGVTRDNIDARELLTANYFYQFSGIPQTNGITVRTALNQDILQSNNHYADVESILNVNPNFDLRPSLEQVRQQIVADNGTAVNNPDPAGLLTSRAYQLMCADMGTNRRCYEQMQKKFMCTSLEGIADTSAPDNWVGIDVTRTPGGDPALFQQSCRGCHGNMDSQRTAFAFYDFANNQVKHGQVNNNGGLWENQTRVAVKYNRGAANGYADGYRVTNSSWRVNQVTGQLGQFFGWRDDAGQSISQPVVGSGVNAYGRLISNSQSYSRCLVQRAYQTVCGRQVGSGETQAVRTIASEFETTGNRKIKWLFERVATDDACIGR